jgi:hypothetical protein
MSGTVNGGWGDLDRPGTRHHDVVWLLSQIDAPPDAPPDERQSWTLHGRPLTDQQWSIVTSARPEHWSDAEALAILDHEIDRARLDRARRNWYRRAEGFRDYEDNE